MNGHHEEKKSECAHDVTVRDGTQKENQERNDFYVYAYLDPRRPGKYRYGKYKFKYEPIYIGKGKNNRIDHCLGGVGNRILRSKMKQFFFVVSLVVEEGLSENQAFEKEQMLISLIGRIDLKTGPLCNLTKGGEGTAGRVATEEWIRKKRISQTGRKHSEETKRKISEGTKGHRGAIHSEEFKKKMSELQTGRIVSKETRGKLSKIRKGKVFSDEWKANISKGKKGKPNIKLRGRPRSEELKRYLSEKQKQYWKIKKGEHQNVC